MGGAPGRWPHRVQAVGLALVFGWGWLCMGAGVPGSLGWVGLALPAGLASSPPLLGAGFAFRPLAAGSPLVPAGLCWALNAWGLLGAGSGSAWASLAPGSPPGCRAGGCPGRAGGGGWAG